MCLSNSAQNQNCNRAVMTTCPMARRRPCKQVDTLGRSTCGQRGLAPKSYWHLRVCPNRPSSPAAALALGIDGLAMVSLTVGSIGASQSPKDARLKGEELSPQLASPPPLAVGDPAPHVARSFRALPEMRSHKVSGGAGCRSALRCIVGDDLGLVVQNHV
jgi:hypothetical protein